MYLVVGLSHINLRTVKALHFTRESRKDGYLVGCEAGMSSSRKGQEAFCGEGGTVAVASQGLCWETRAGGSGGFLGDANRRIGTQKMAFEGRSNFNLWVFFTVKITCGYTRNNLERSVILV